MIRTPGVRLLAGMICILGSAGMPAAGGEQSSALEQGRELTRLFYEGELAPLWERFDPALKAAFGDLAGLKRFREQVAAQMGSESAVLEENAETLGPVTMYERRARFDKLPIPVLIQWSLDAKGKVAGFLVTSRTEAPSEYLDYQTKTPLRLPFQGEWFVAWGGRSVLRNQHAGTRDQRFAYDLLIMKEGSTHAGEGKRNEDYHCFGRPILAPGAGTVIAVESQIEDNTPGRMNREQPLGNHVIVDHGNGEFSLLAHLQQGTVAVNAGDRVNPGQLLGRCGNSGNSSEPHLHYHLQNGPKPFDADGLPAQFLDYLADGRPVERGEPVRGQTIQPRSDLPAPGNPKGASETGVASGETNPEGDPGMTREPAGER